MKRTISVTLTVYEAEILLHAADSGSDGGKLFIDDDGTGYGGKRALAAFGRAEAKIVAAMKQCAGESKPIHRRPANGTWGQ
jgi:hypothetical protein